jgi:type I restriction-modification system DNA methylase subunit
MKLISKFEMFYIVISMNIYGCEIDDIMKLLRWMKLIQEKWDTWNFIWTITNYQTKKDMDESHNKDEYDKIG